MSKPTKKAELLIQELLVEFTPQELEPRLELQILIDPMASLLDTNNNNNNNNNNRDPIWV